MKLSIVVVAIFASILGKASPVTRDDASDVVRTETASSLSNEDASSSPLLVVSRISGHTVYRTAHTPGFRYRKATACLITQNELVRPVLWA